MAQCNVPDCDRDIGLKGAKGMCPMHYRRWRRTGHIDIQPKQWMNQQACSVEGCDESARKVGLCATHYSRLRKYGQLAPMKGKWARADEPCCWCGGPRAADRGRSMYCSSNCQVLRSQNMRRGVKQRAASFECSRCGDDTPLPIRSDGVRMKRADTLMCPPCKHARLRTRHHMAVHRLVRRDGSNCGICGEHVDVTLKKPHPLSPTVDHIIPFARGGSHDPENLQLAHYTCNCRKNATLPAGVNPAA